MLVGLAIVLVSAVGLFVCTRAVRASPERSSQTQGAIWLLLLFGIMLPIGLAVVGLEAAGHAVQAVIDYDLLRISRHD